MFRAELYAVLRALRATKGPLEVVSDCAGVVTSGNRYLGGKVVTAKAAHADLWRQLQQEATDFFGIEESRMNEFCLVDHKTSKIVRYLLSLSLS